ncbi:MAG TPA: pyridoxal-dependent decarboxylase [Actinomycetales bacterium]|nr:pyridoxal-dependent decarboxylase [Actinomycetales bacterium]
MAAELEHRCVAMLANLWHAPQPGAATGCSTTGSSEGCMLAALALLERWSACCGATAPRSRMSWSSTLTASAATCPRSP